MAKQFTQIVGFVLVVVGILGFIMGEKMLLGLHFSTLHNSIHILSGAVLAYLGFKGNANNQRLGAQIFGVVYGLVAILGFLKIGHLPEQMVSNPFRLDLNLNPMYNIIHSVIAAWGLWAGFAKKTVPAAS